MKKKLLSFWEEEKGAVLAVVALGLVSLLGFAAIVVDYGVLALQRRKLVTAADAAALAGAQELIHNSFHPEAAEAKAVEYAVFNGVEGGRVTAKVSEGNRAITVEVEGTVDYTFARLLGYERETVSVRAKAVTGPIKSMKGIVPLAIVEQEFEFGKEYVLKYSDWKKTGLDPGSYGALSLGGKGADLYRDNVKYGYQDIISIGDIIEVESGNMSGPTAQGINYRLEQCRGLSPADISPGCPLLIYIPVVELYSPGSKQVVIAGFAAFFINRDKPPGPGNENAVTGVFVKRIALGEISRQAADFGVYGINLVE